MTNEMREAMAIKLLFKRVRLEQSSAEQQINAACNSVTEEDILERRDKVKEAAVQQHRHPSGALRGVCVWVLSGRF